MPRALLFAMAGTVADVDLLVGTHRGATHSLAAACLAAIAAWGWCALARGGRGGRGDARLALAIGAAYATHTLLDWLGADSSPPMGIMAWWPMTHAYYVSPQPVFLAISRRYWRPDFLALNVWAVMRELVILGPLMVASVWGRRRSR
jgi:membrane-bound metal-dependent hydrolase YbcI (DUF457 family)